MIEQVVEAFNRHIERQRLKLGIDSRCYLVARKRIEDTEQFKLYKTVIVEVLMVDKGIPKIAFRSQFSGRVPEQHKEYILNNLEAKVTEIMFDFIVDRSKDYNDLIMGTYEGYSRDE